MPPADWKSRGCAAAAWPVALAEAGAAAASASDVDLGVGLHGLAPAFQPGAVALRQALRSRSAHAALRAAMAVSVMSSGTSAGAAAGAVVWASLPVVRAWLRAARPADDKPRSRCPTAHSPGYPLPRRPGFGQCHRHPPEPPAPSFNPKIVHNTIPLTTTTTADPARIAGRLLRARMPRLGAGRPRGGGGAMAADWRRSLPDLGYAERSEGHQTGGPGVIQPGGIEPRPRTRGP